jgi:hypothetical protein
MPIMQREEGNDLPLILQQKLGLLIYQLSRDEPQISLDLFHIIEIH